MYVHQIQRPALYLIISVCGLFYNSLAQATSFNCLSPNLKKFEEMICTNTTLSILDERVNSYYEDALKLSQNSDELKKFQKTNMASRKNCKTVACLQAIYENSLQYLKNHLKNHPSVDANKPTYPVWISSLLTDPELKTACANWKGSDMDLESDDIACKALNIMQNAKPANRSAANDFVFTEKSVDFLPNLLRSEAGNGNRCDNYILNRHRISIKQSENYQISERDNVITKITPLNEEKILSTVIDKNQLTLDFERHNRRSYQLNIKILGRGDLLDTGWESLLIQVLKINSSSTSSSFRNIKLLILSRKASTDVFQVADAEKTLPVYPQGLFICAEVTYQSRE
jgi:uncharacterized protein